MFVSACLLNSRRLHQPLASSAIAQTLKPEVPARLADGTPRTGSRLRPEATEFRPSPAAPTDRGAGGRGGERGGDGDAARAEKRVSRDGSGRKRPAPEEGEAPREGPRDAPREPKREAPREPKREAPREPTREVTREPTRFKVEAAVAAGAPREGRHAVVAPGEGPAERRGPRDSGRAEERHGEPVVNHKANALAAAAGIKTDGRGTREARPLRASEEGGARRDAGREQQPVKVERQAIKAERQPVKAERGGGAPAEAAEDGSRHGKRARLEQAVRFEAPARA